MDLGHRLIAGMRWRLRGPSEDSTLIVAVPGADELVAGCHKALGITPAGEIPPHVTVLYPFIPPSQMDDEIEGKLETVFANFHPFAFSFDGLGHFPGVTWLRPNPATGFAALTDAVVRAFPDYPPYQGAFDATIHHVTVAMRGRLPASLEETLLSMLPVVGDAQEVWLMCRPARGSWYLRRRFPFG